MSFMYTNVFFFLCILIFCRYMKYVVDTSVSDEYKYFRFSRYIIIHLGVLDYSLYILVNSQKKDSACI